MIKRKALSFCASLLLVSLPAFAAHLERSRARPLEEFQFVQLEKQSDKTIGEWMPGKVPGDVMTDLVRAGKLKHPYYDFNSQEALWVNDYDWLYQTNFPAELNPGERLWILFNGIDYESRGFLNGEKLFQHTGMFSRIFIDATPYLKPGGRNQLEVKLFGLGNRPHSQQYYVDQFIEQLMRRKYLKTQMSFGWDIAVELINAGIWDKVELFQAGPAMIKDLGIKTKNSGEVNLELALDSAQAGEAVLKILVMPENFGDGKPVFEKEFPIQLEAGQSIANSESRIPNYGGPGI